MRIVGHFHSSEPAYALSMRLLNAGIATHVEDERAKFGHERWTVFVVLEAQYNDAMKLMADPNYEVKNPADLGHYYDYITSQQAKEDALSAILKGSLVILAILLAIVFGIRYVLQHQAAQGL